MLHRALIALALLFQVSPSAAFELTVPDAATLVSQTVAEIDSYAVPIGPFADGVLPSLMLEGQVTRQSWRVEALALTSLQLMAPLRAQLTALGYETLLACGTRACGGFDFRFETEVLPAPDMHVDLGDFRFLSAALGADDHVSLLISRSANAGYIQMIRVTQNETPAAVLIREPAIIPAATTASVRPVSPTEMAEMLTQGHVILADLAFKTGSAELNDGPYRSLEKLAIFIKSEPTRRVALVGHTDAVGDLNRNIALSKRRASSVLERLVSAYNVPRSQLRAEGMGFLSPIAPNHTDLGRDANRRVEAVLLNTE